MNKEKNENVKINLFEILPHKFGEFKFCTRRSDDNKILAYGNNKKKILKDSKYELIKQEQLIGVYELVEIK